MRLGDEPRVSVPKRRSPRQTKAYINVVVPRLIVVGDEDSRRNESAGAVIDAAAVQLFHRQLVATYTRIFATMVKGRHVLRANASNAL